MRGLGMVPMLLVVLVVLVIAGAAWWFLGRKAPVTAPATPTPTVATAENTGTLEPVEVRENLNVNDLYKQARAAMSENRMVAPPGNNALEYYLRILAVQPDDATAMDALREIFPFATGSAEDQINQGDFAEANRIIELLAKADPSNYALTILRSKLDAKRRLVEREEAQKEVALAAAAKAEAEARAKAAAAAAAPEPVAEEPAATAASPASAQAPAAVATTTPAAPPTPPPAPVGETRDVRVLVPPSPSYPAAAVRNRQNGWVEVEFTVAEDGSVKNARVTASQPRGVFDQAALSAVQKAKFEPRLLNGVAEAATLRRRIEFNLN
ncbi:energy transducer TonB [Dokdonella sp.]|uniref:energy transducer TonB n=1 Tax=Dokdonella sp. TaxID=2291710 RepID=UPI0031C0DA02|nr:energy transducer TonB [Dokdonella sp.]